MHNIHQGWPTFMRRDNTRAAYRTGVGVHNEVLPVADLNIFVSPYLRPDRIIGIVSHATEMPTPETLPPLIKVVRATLIGYCRRERDHRGKRNQRADEHIGALGRQVLRDLKRYRQIKSPR